MFEGKYIAVIAVITVSLSRFNIVCLTLHSHDSHHQQYFAGLTYATYKHITTLILVPSLAKHVETLHTSSCYYLSWTTANTLSYMH